MSRSEWSAAGAGSRTGSRSDDVVRVGSRHRLVRPCAYTCSAFPLAAFSKLPVHETWNLLINSLGVQSDSKQVSPVQGTPVLSGAVQNRGVQAYPELLLLLDQPARGAGSSVSHGDGRPGAGDNLAFISTVSRESPWRHPPNTNGRRGSLSYSPKKRPDRTLDEQRALETRPRDSESASEIHVRFNLQFNLKWHSNEDCSPYTSH